jgi:hypothetical protein
VSTTFVGRLIRKRRILLVVAVLTALPILVGQAQAVEEPTALVAATFSLEVVEPIVQTACAWPNLYDQFALDFTGTETDTSYPPHPELSGTLALHLITNLPVSGAPAMGTFTATLTGADGNVSYKGRGMFSAQVSFPGGVEHVSGRGTMMASLYQDGVPTEGRLVANLSFDENLLAFTVTGDFGQSSSVPGWAVETAGSC